MNKKLLLSVLLLLNIGVGVLPVAATASDDEYEGEYEGGDGASGLEDITAAFERMFRTDLPSDQAAVEAFCRDHIGLIVAMQQMIEDQRKSIEAQRSAGTGQATLFYEFVRRSLECKQNPQLLVSYWQMIKKVMEHMKRHVSLTFQRDSNKFVQAIACFMLELELYLKNYYYALSCTYPRECEQLNEALGETLRPLVEELHGMIERLSTSAVITKADLEAIAAFFTGCQTRLFGGDIAQARSTLTPLIELCERMADDRLVPEAYRLVIGEQIPALRAALMMLSRSARRPSLEEEDGGAGDAAFGGKRRRD